MKLNILHLQTELNITCGISKTIFTLIDKTKNSHNYFIATFGGDGFERFIDIGIQPIILKNKRENLFNFPVIIYKVYKICKKNQIDIIHAHHRYFDLVAFFVSKLIKIKTITSVHSFVKGRKRLSYKSEILIACSYAIKNHLINYFKVKENKINVIYNFVDKSEIRISINKMELKRELLIPEEKTIIGFIGRFDNEEKGIDVLIKALNEISKVYSNIFLLLVGSGKDEKIIYNELSKSNFDYKILGAQLNIYDYYNLMDIFVLPSRIEPLGIVILEAGIMSKVVIGCNTGGIREIIQDNKDGFLFEPGNHLDLKNTIIRTLTEYESATKMGINLRQKVLANYSVEHGILSYERAYKNLIIHE
jgi:glycosyltransferase involved in cell wall biosynthesis